ncbi:acetyl-coenzyme A synthetase N-terminal domain-containing protein, partial [Arthrobacter bambusae]|uniref:acetyl-coenzyme A synthetase N-terminal domain-containing protein n=1 Tax=Arthrobacter bambusae TaxID=1338426 RepID=UPI00277E4EFF
MADYPTESDETLANLLHEQRRFLPEAGFTAQANATVSDYAESDADRLAFWARQAERLDWSQKWTEVLDWSNPPFAKWFIGGKLNAAYNCLDQGARVVITDLQQKPLDEAVAKVGPNCSGIV